VKPKPKPKAKTFEDVRQMCADFLRTNIRSNTPPDVARWIRDIARRVVEMREPTPPTCTSGKRKAPDVRYQFPVWTKKEARK
jgi:hypothetical protein